MEKKEKYKRKYKKVNVLLVIYYQKGKQLQIFKNYRDKMGNLYIQQQKWDVSESMK